MLSVGGKRLSRSVRKLHRQVFPELWPDVARLAKGGPAQPAEETPDASQLELDKKAADWERRFNAMTAAPKPRRPFEGISRVARDTGGDS